uniref:Uncharacterized protein n=1 Tax=Panagrolaimus davidi TaxID=227884 RepID=A0A914PEY6_9BILA
MASIKYLFAISFLIIIAFNSVLAAPVSSKEVVDRKNNDSEESPETDKKIPAKINDASLNEQDTDESIDGDEKSSKPEHAHKHKDHSDHLDVDEDDTKAKKVDKEDDSDSVKSDKLNDKSGGSEKYQKEFDDKSTALEADKPAATSHSEEEGENDIRKPLADNTYPKAPAATAAEDRQQQSREIVDKDTKAAVSDEASDKHEEVPAPVKGSGTMTQEENEGVANLTEDKQMDERQDGISVVQTTTKSPNSGMSASVSFLLIFLSIMLYLLQ